MSTGPGFPLGADQLSFSNSRPSDSVANDLASHASCIYAPSSSQAHESNPPEALVKSPLCPTASPSPPSLDFRATGDLEWTAEIAIPSLTSLDSSEASTPCESFRSYSSTSLLRVSPRDVARQNLHLPELPPLEKSLIILPCQGLFDSRTQTSPCLSLPTVQSREARTNTSVHVEVDSSNTCLSTISEAIDDGQPMTASLEERYLETPLTSDPINSSSYYGNSQLFSSQRHSPSQTSQGLPDQVDNYSQRAGSLDQLPSAPPTDSKSFSSHLSSEIPPMTRPASLPPSYPFSSSPVGPSLSLQPHAHDRNEATKPNSHGVRTTPTVIDSVEFQDSVMENGREEVCPHPNLIPSKRPPELLSAGDGVTVSSTFITHSSNDKCRSQKRSKPDLQPEDACPIDVPPKLRRPTTASHVREHKKLAAPFRSPLLNKTSSAVSRDLIRGPVVSGPKNLFKSRSRSPMRPNAPRTDTVGTGNQRSGTASTTIRKVASAKAAAQFKSPLSNPIASSLSRESRSHVNLSAHALEREIQLVKRALKIQQTGEEERLQELAKKWREVGQEVAWTLWDACKDIAGGDSWVDSSHQRGDLGSKTLGGEGSKARSWLSSNWGWDTSADQETLSQHPSIECNGEGVGGGEDPSTPENPTKLLSELYRNLSREITIRRQTILPPTPRGAYFEGIARSEINALHGSPYSDMHPMYPVEHQDDQVNEDEERETYTLGTMLRHCGIAPATLGWNEDEGDFVAE